MSSPSSTIFHLGPADNRGLCTPVDYWTEPWLQNSQQPDGGTLVICGHCRQPGILPNQGQERKFAEALGIQVTEPTPSPGSPRDLPASAGAREASSRASERSRPVNPTGFGARGLGVLAVVVAWARVGAGEVRLGGWWRPLGARFVVLLVGFVGALLVGQLLRLAFWVGGVVAR